MGGPASTVDVMQPVRITVPVSAIKTSVNSSVVKTSVVARGDCYASSTARGTGQRKRLGA